MIYTWVWYSSAPPPSYSILLFSWMSIWIRMEVKLQNFCNCDSIPLMFKILSLLAHQVVEQRSRRVSFWFVAWLKINMKYIPQFISINSSIWNRFASISWIVFSTKYQKFTFWWFRTGFISYKSVWQLHSMTCLGLKDEFWWCFMFGSILTVKWIAVAEI